IRVEREPQAIRALLEVDERTVHYASDRSGRNENTCWRARDPILRDEQDIFPLPSMLGFAVNLPRPPNVAVVICSDQPDLAEFAGPCLRTNANERPVRCHVTHMLHLMLRGYVSDFANPLIVSRMVLPLCGHCRREGPSEQRACSRIMVVRSIV